AVEQDLQYYEVERSLDSLNFEIVGTLPAQNLTTVNNYRFTDIASDSKIFYRLRSINKDGRWDYSSTITVFNQSSESFIYPSSISNNIISCFLPGGFDQLEAFSMTGVLVIKKDIRGMTGRIDISVFHLARGLYMVRLTRGSEKRVQRILIQ
ncbi:MAG TPA: T9SS type A sorting domain-containing protein, partial [Chitinophagaceae bacterium]|nr:T9SS type A sorting domain-containing protein [Chitinophagaceae bacterium]